MLNNNFSYAMMAKRVKALALLYPMIQFLNICVMGCFTVGVMAKERGAKLYATDERYNSTIFDYILHLITCCV